MSDKPNTITLDDVEYIRADSVTVTPDGDHVLVRSRDAGVFVGVLVGKNNDEVVLHNARRIWYWDGAATLSELAIQGTSKPKTCKFPTPVPSITVLGVCEIIDMTAKAVESVYAVPVWTQQ